MMLRVFFPNASSLLLDRSFSLSFSFSSNTFAPLLTPRVPRRKQPRASRSPTCPVRATWSQRERRVKKKQGEKKRMRFLVFDFLQLSSPPPPPLSKTPNTLSLPLLVSTAAKLLDQRRGSHVRRALPLRLCRGRDRLKHGNGKRHLGKRLAALALLRDKAL